MSVFTCQNGLLFLFFCPLFSVGSLSFTLAHNARRLCEVFCILQNLQMYEVPERASDGKASGRCDGSPKGFRHITQIYASFMNHQTNLKIFLIHLKTNSLTIDFY